MLLKRMQPFTRLLQQTGSFDDLQELCAALQETVEDSHVYLISRRGRVLAYALQEGFESTPFDAEWLGTDEAPEELQSTVNRVAALSVMEGENGESILIAPVVGGDARVASLLFVADSDIFGEDEQIIAEFASTAFGMIISRAIDEKQEDEAQETRAARSAINSLSYSEVLAMQRIFEELEGDEGLLVASRIADEAGITRSVIVNALRKLASANVIESRSLGMKGTYLRILNKEIRKEFEKQWYPHPRQNN